MSLGRSAFRSLVAAVACLLVVASCETGGAPARSPATLPATTNGATPSPTPPAGPAPQRGGVLRTWAAAIPTSFDLHSEKDESMWAAVLPMVNWLVANEQGGRGLVPELAERWTTSGVQYLFSLDRRARFHDGSPLVAADVIESLQRVIANPDAPYRRPLQNVARMEAVGEYAVRVTLERPDPTFLAGLGAIGNAIFLAFRQPGTAPSFDPVGTGPFRLEEYVPGQRLRLARNPGYFLAGPEGLPYLDAIEISAVADGAVGIAALQAGQMDLSPPLPAADVAGNLSNIGRTVFPGPIRLLAFSSSSAWKDLRLRQALALSLDREALAEGASEGLGAGARAWFLPPREQGGRWALTADALRGLPGYGDRREQTARAADLLRQAGGWPDDVTLLVRETDRGASEALASQIALLLGKDVRPSIVGREDYDGRTATGQFGLALGTASAFLDDPTIALDPLFKTGGASNIGRWEDPEVDRLLSAIAREPDAARRQTFTAEAQRRLINLAWYIPLGPAAIARLHGANVEGMARPLLLEDGPSWRLERVWLRRG